ncbi:hypothetical protein EYF80_064727 [Liparis tanakae]|uniref:C2 domain-containing protein n=1 Tax=Liparis tanakae TaxID=230148 RepID=A0A4Z2E8Q5_9TELE|nr:hypothetical protein EYF80_064727 [Liparis tanakae]
MRLCVCVFLFAILPFQTLADLCIGKNLSVWVSYGKNITNSAGEVPTLYVKVDVDNDIRKTETEHTENPSWWQKFDFGFVGVDVMTINLFEVTMLETKLLVSCPEMLATEGRDIKHVVCRVGESGIVYAFFRCTEM